MGIRVKAMYEEGVLKPLEKVSLKEGEELEIEIFPSEDKIEKAFKELEEVIPSLESIVDIGEISPNKYMDKDYALKKIGI
ncbi:MAG: antitoxin family protein [Methanophagales archaeon]|nr:antitoxin family protein [Methanophagales archaeon]